MRRSPARSPSSAAPAPRTPVPPLSQLRARREAGRAEGRAGRAAWRAGPDRPRCGRRRALAGAVRGALGPRAGGRCCCAHGRGDADADGRRLLEALSLEPPAARYRRGAGRVRRARLPNAARVPVLERAAMRGLRAAPAAGTGRAAGGAAGAVLGGRLGPGDGGAWRGCAPRCAAAAIRPPPARPQCCGSSAAASRSCMPLCPACPGELQVLPGIVLRRDFAAYCPADGELRALLVSEPLQPALTAPGVEFVVDSEGQYQASLRWITKRTEALMKHLQSNNVKLLLSSSKQEEAVIHYAKLYGVSVVECLSSEEMALITEITGVSPYAPFGDNMDRQITETAVVTFCRPLLLVSKRCVHIGFTSVCAFQPHCLILCGPVDGVNEQHADALQEAFTMLQQLFKTVDRREEWRAEGESQSETSDVCTWHSTTQKQLVIENTYCDSNQVSECQLKAVSDETETKILDPDKSDLLVHNRKKHTTTVLVVRNTDTVTTCECLDVAKGVEKICCHVVPFKQEESSVGITQDYSNTLIEAGSVLPVGGYFEILLHYYIQDYAKQCQQSEVTVICNVVADALLSIPKTLYRTTKRDSFTKFYLEAINSLRRNQPLPDKGLESVYCKYQLVISVLHCVTELLSIDLIIGIRRPLQKIEDRDSEDDF
uniref:Bardet-Biedl syndrome 10 n=1 Tax=Malurus cyaneus samueli TaxID=2593467 RepID=A0A8C5U731_9PASS